MLGRETSRSQVQALRQQATLWREPQDDNVLLNSKKVNPHQFRKNNSHLYSNSKRVDEESNPIWDDNGCLLKKTENKVPAGMRRSASVASFHSSIYSNQKFDNNTKKSKVQQFENSSRYDDSGAFPTSRSRLTKKQQEDSVIRLTARKNPVREKSVQPRLLSTDFEGFIHRQTNCSKARHQKPAPIPEYKIDVSEGSKKLLQRSQKLSSHSIYNLKTKNNREEELEARNQNESNFSVRPKIRKHECRLANLNLEEEKERKEDGIALLRAKYDNELFNTEEKQVKPKLNSRSSSRYIYQNDESYIPPKYQPNSVYSTRKRIEAKILEMKPILEADQEEITWSVKEKKNRKKNKNKAYIPDYMKTINDVIRPSWEDDHKRGKK